MSIIYPLYLEAARHEVSRRLRDADDEHRRLARRPSATRPRFRTPTIAA
ncbi:hypothetical protein [Nocardioides sp. URHA0032]|nr:hypothetical protein [Nocardioides sp. URHA0032]